LEKLRKTHAAKTSFFRRLTKKWDSSCSLISKRNHRINNLGRKLTVSNPHRSASARTDGITIYQYDALGRVTQVAPPDGTVPTPGSTCLATTSAPLIQETQLPAQTRQASSAAASVTLWAG
jgi:hypothetical protein